MLSCPPQYNKDKYILFNHLYPQYGFNIYFLDPTLKES